ncbi:hypothetical protein PEC18_29610 [Paucibacter sp. O1-1]|nr:hypothetical protein [Paucibacter sp. O1-1]MDA3829898.1 hypothetical protein [Paucibacter sp. O1-1]
MRTASVATMPHICRRSNADAALMTLIPEQGTPMAARWGAGFGTTRLSRLAPLVEAYLAQAPQLSAATAGKAALGIAEWIAEDDASMLKALTSLAHRLEAKDASEVLRLLVDKAAAPEPNKEPIRAVLFPSPMMNEALQALVMRSEMATAEQLLPRVLQAAQAASNGRRIVSLLQLAIRLERRLNPQTGDWSRTMRAVEAAALRVNDPGAASFLVLMLTHEPRASGPVMDRRLISRLLALEPKADGRERRQIWGMVATLAVRMNASQADVAKLVDRLLNQLEWLNTDNPNSRRSMESLPFIYFRQLDSSVTHIDDPAFGKDRVAPPAILELVARDQRLDVAQRLLQLAAAQPTGSDSDLLRGRINLATQLPRGSQAPEAVMAALKRLSELWSAPDKLGLVYGDADSRTASAEFSALAQHLSPQDAMQAIRTLRLEEQLRLIGDSSMRWGIAECIVALLRRAQQTWPQDIDATLDLLGVLEDAPQSPDFGFGTAETDFLGTDKASCGCACVGIERRSHAAGDHSNDREAGREVRSPTLHVVGDFEPS